jgi:membrane protein
MVRILDFVVSFVGITVMFALLFKFVPAATVKWKDVWVGAGLTSFLFSIGKILIGLYLGNGAIGSTFGAARSLVVIMLWAYYSSQIILYGAEFSRLYAERFGSDIVPDANALRVVTRTVKTRPARILRAYRHESGKQH